MYHLIIAAWPESANVIMVGQETEETDAVEVYRDYAFLPRLIPAIKQAINQFEDGAIKDCCVYGPTGYIEKIATDIQSAFPDMSVTIQVYKWRLNFY